MQTRKLQITCPVCSSPDVVYTCTPNCCFNHVCGACGSTFEPVTVTTGRIIKGLVPPEPLPDSSDPTVACAKCDATTVYLISEGRLGCSTCGSELALEVTAVAASGN